MAERWVALTASIPGLDLAVPNRFIALNSAGSILHRNLVGYYFVFVLHFYLCQILLSQFSCLCRPLLGPSRQTKAKRK